MRITKKFTGKERLGKKLYKDSHDSNMLDTSAARERAMAHLQVVKHPHLTKT
jgi:hypothetical protein